MSQHTSAGSTYEGRPLPRPDEEIVDQGLGFDVATLINRRRALRAFGLGAAALGLAACTSGTTTATSGTTSSAATAGGTTASGTTSAGTSAAGTSAGTTAAGTTAASTIAAGEIPEETAGPYPGDGSNGPDVLEEAGVVRNDLRSSFGGSSGTAEGVPMTLELTISDLANGGARRSPAQPSMSGTAIARAGTPCTRRASRTRTTCAACR